MPKSTTFLSLGSNLDDKLQYLQTAVDRINQNIGSVCAVSSVFQTPAWGFEGNDFYNICIEVTTDLSAIAFLEELLALETALGRKRSNSQGYENRVIDIDIILFDDLVMKSEKLTVPHPKAFMRKFVLLPLEEIKSDLVFPELNLPIREVLENCEDNSIVSKTAIQIATKKNITITKNKEVTED